MHLINQATGETLTRTDDGLQLKPRISDDGDPSQQWILDYNSNFSLTTGCSQEKVLLLVCGRGYKRTFFL